MIYKVKLEIGRICSRYLGQPGNSFGGELYNREVKGISLSQAVVTKVVTKPEMKITLRKKQDTWALEVKQRDLRNLD